MKDKLLTIMWQDLRPLKLVTIPLAFLTAIGIGIQYYSESLHDFEMMLKIGPWWIWSLGFVIVGIARFIGLFVWLGTRFTRQGTPALAILLWSMMFAGSDILTPIEGMGLLYLIPLSIEVWILGRALADEGIGF